MIDDRTPQPDDRSPGDAQTVPLEPVHADARPARRRTWTRPALVVGALIVATGLAGGGAALAAQSTGTVAATGTAAAGGSGRTAPTDAPTAAPTPPAEGTAPVSPSAPGDQADADAPAAPAPGTRGPADCAAGERPAPPAGGAAPEGPLQHRPEERTDGVAPTPPTGAPTPRTDAPTPAPSEGS